MSTETRDPPIRSTKYACGSMDTKTGNLFLLSSDAYTMHVKTANVNKEANIRVNA